MPGIGVEEFLERSQIFALFYWVAKGFLQIPGVSEF